MASDPGETTESPKRSEGDRPALAWSRKLPQTLPAARARKTRSTVLAISCRAEKPRAEAAAPRHCPRHPGLRSRTRPAQEELPSFREEERAQRDGPRPYRKKNKRKREEERKVLGKTNGRQKTQNTQENIKTKQLKLTDISKNSMIYLMTITVI